MKVFVVKTLEEGINMNECSVAVFQNENDAVKHAEEMIAKYADEYDGDVEEPKNAHFYFMRAEDEYVTIEIEEHEVR